MIRTIKYSIIAFLFFPTFTLFANPVQTDSLLLRKIDEARGERKLELMLELANTHVFSKEKIIGVANRLEEEALSQKNMKYVAASYALKTRYFSGENNLDSTVYYGNLCNNTYSEYNINNPAQTYQFMANVYMNNGYYELAIHYLNLYIKAHKDDVLSYRMLGMYYLHVGKFDLSKKYLLEGLSLAESDQNTTVFHMVSFYTGLATLTYSTEDFQDALYYCSIAENLLDNMTEIGLESDRERCYSLIYVLYTLSYIGVEDTENSKIYLDKALEIPYSQSGELAILWLDDAMFEYYFLLKDYDNAVKYLDKIFAYGKNKFEYSTLFHEILEKKIKLLKTQGKYKEALSVQKELINNKDSIYKRNVPLQISELSKSYELDKARIEKEKDKANLQRSQAIIIGFIITTILLCLILYIIRRNSKHLKAKNKALYKQRVEVDAYIKLIKESALTSNAEESLSKEGLLFVKLEKYMKEEEVFKNFDLDREEIALALGTNRQYLVDAIKSEAGKTFMDYVNDYRLDYARDQLIIDETRPVTSIIYESGFSSITTFYRLFKNKFGMTPNELRKIKDELKNEIIKEDNTK